MQKIFYFLIIPTLATFLVRNTDFILIYGIFILPIYFNILLKKILKNNEIRKNIIILFTCIINVIEWDILTFGELYNAVTIVFFGKTNTTLDPGAHQLIIIMAAVSLLIFLLVLKLLDKKYRKVG